MANNICLQYWQVGFQFYANLNFEGNFEYDLQGSHKMHIICGGATFKFELEWVWWKFFVNNLPLSIHSKKFSQLKDKALFRKYFLQNNT